MSAPGLAITYCSVSGARGLRNRMKRAESGLWEMLQEDCHSCNHYWGLGVGQYLILVTHRRQYELAVNPLHATGTSPHSLRQWVQH